MKTRVGKCIRLALLISKSRLHLCDPSKHMTFYSKKISEEIKNEGTAQIFIEVNVALPPTEPKDNERFF